MCGLNVNFGDEELEECSLEKDSANTQELEGCGVSLDSIFLSVSVPTRDYTTSLTEIVFPQ